MALSRGQQPKGDPQGTMPGSEAGKAPTARGVAKAKNTLYRFRVKAGVHIEKGVCYGKDEPAGAIVTTTTNLHEKLNDPNSDKFELLDSSDAPDEPAPQAEGLSEAEAQAKDREAHEAK